jgi:putative transposase
MMATIRYYQREKPSIKFSKYLNLSIINRNPQDDAIPSPDEKLVELIAFCLMPTHLHFIVKQLKQNGISTFMSTILNSYTRYFNTKYKRKGPLWEGRFKNAVVQTDEQLLHLTRYIHLNPVTAYLVDKPEEWPASSYKEYMLMVDDSEKICTYDGLLQIEPDTYRKFVINRASYQRDLAHIKELLIDHP